MKLHYSMAHEPLLDRTGRDELIANMKKAGIQKIWIAGFFSGKMVDMEELKEAKAFAEAHGFEVGSVTIPIGHPGNSLNPDDPDLDLEIPDRWHYRVNNLGETVYFCGAIDNCLIEDNGQAAKRLYEAGFHEVFLDDDLRVGNFNALIEGCYCDVCISEFNEIYKHQETRASLMRQITEKLSTELMKDWVAFQCEKITAVIKATNIEGVQPGIMVMHFGDERHGIDIPTIRNQIPDTLFRVGELQFNDASFTKPYAKAEEMLGIAYHLNFMDKQFAYSESTIFPPRSLKEHNLVYKAKMAIASGLENVLFMSGTWVLEESYWKAIADALPVLREFDKAGAGVERHYPVHLAYGTHGAYAEPIVPTSLPVLAGLPVKPVRADQRSEGGELLLFFGDYELGAEWQKKLPLYKQVIFDQTAALKNKAVLEQLKPDAAQLICWDHAASTRPSNEEISLLQKRVGEESRSFPRVMEGSNIGLVWLKDSGKVILFNLLETKNQGVVMITDHPYTVTLKALSFAILDGAGTWTEYDTEVNLGS
ncbi:hypothetical protein [Paenibacillus nasutitermitis]|uniref:Uncharacterized protein n=1 Tax=Paenibacillus nasutitermitis TaxID=1652958 RepID=A0A916YLY9_9BACL|nr:hypothetical protein [Paenibacillus nasutitermitis]GGD52397.1 hypothetical protein GCM10010911_07410 [Paenibacillus nasutitermitis]